MNEEGKVFGYFIDRTAKVIKSDINKRFRKLGADVTPEQWLLLNKLSQKNGQSQVELGEGTYKNAPTISRIIDLLCKKEFAERQPYEGDRRKFKIYITQKGRELVERTKPEIINARQDGWSGLNNHDYEELMRIINQVFNNLNG